MNSLRWVSLLAIPFVVFSSVLALMFTERQDVVQAQVAAPAPITMVERLEVPQDPVERAEFDRVFFQKMAAERAERTARGLVERIKWKGCDVKVTADPEDEDAFVEQHEVADVLMEQQPTPKQRDAEFDWVISRPDMHLVGWDLEVSNVSDAKDGRVVELIVRPKLVWDGANITWIPYTCKETWRLGFDNELAFQGIQPVPGGVKAIFGH